MRQLAILLLPLIVTACSKPTSEASQSPKIEAVSNEYSKFFGAAEARANWPDSRFAIVKFVYPAEAAKNTKLKAWLEADRERLTADLLKRAKQDATDESWGEAVSPYRDEHEWKIVADLPDWTSLSDRSNIWSGGAHHNTNYDQVLWNKPAQKRLNPLDMFVSKAVFDNEFHKPFCTELNKARSTPDFEFSEDEPNSVWPCPDPADLVIVLGSSNKEQFDRVGFLVKPYVANAYAGGSYEITLPITKAALGIVKPEYRRFFATSTGSLAINVPNS